MEKQRKRAFFFFEDYLAEIKFIIIVCDLILEIIGDFDF